MSNTPEGKIKSQIMHYLKGFDAWVWCPSDRFRHGIPDICMLYKGLNIWLEVKKDERACVTGRAKRQNIEMERMSAHGARCYMVWSLKQVITIMEELCKTGAIGAEKN